MKENLESLIQFDTRHFNDISVDTITGFITKTSSDESQKILNEINWYETIREDIKPYLPSIGCVDKEKPLYSMELIPGDDLSKKFINMEDVDWKQTTNQVIDLLELIHSDKQKTVGTKERKKQFYLTKHKKRFSKLKESFIYEQYSRNFMCDDGVYYVGLSELESHIESLVNEILS